MNPVDDAIERAEKHPFHPIYEDWPDRQTLAAEVKRLREELEQQTQVSLTAFAVTEELRAELATTVEDVKGLTSRLADCRKGLVRWDRDT